MKLLFICTITLALGSCFNNNNHATLSENLKQQQSTQTDLTEANKDILKQEETAISNYIRANKLSMSQTNTGLYYFISNKGIGNTAIKKDLVTIKRKSYLLDNTPCYGFGEDSIKTVAIDYDNVESGLHEGLKLLNAGAKAKIIIPSYLAYGISGDGDKIPSMATVVYDLEVLKIEK